MYRLHDSSVWIEYRRGVRNFRTARLRQDLATDQVGTCAVIVQEVLQGIRIDEDFESQAKSFKGLIFLEWDAMEAAVAAAALYRRLPKMGITIRKPNDCLIAAFALYFDADLCHNDRDFDQIAAHTELKIWQE